MTVTPGSRAMGPSYRINCERENIDIENKTRIKKGTIGFKRLELVKSDIGIQTCTGTKKLSL